MKKKQITIPLRGEGSSLKNSLVCRQCGKPVNVISKLVEFPAADKSLSDLCVDCFVKTNHYDFRQLPLPF